MEYNTTIGVDVSDKTSKICVMAKLPGGERKIVVEWKTRRALLEDALSRITMASVRINGSSQSAWQFRMIYAHGVA